MPNCGDKSLPVFDWGCKFKSPVEIIKLLLKPNDSGLTCTAVPYNIASNVCFIDDVSFLSSKNDWKCDDMGVWRNNGVQSPHFILEHDGEVNAVGKNEVTKIVGKEYVYKRMY